MDEEKTKESIRNRYAEIALQNTSCCCGPSCCGSEAQETEEIALNLGYEEDELKKAPAEANMGLGCGNPVAKAKAKKGETVLDLGCGGGLDCFLALQEVGEEGYVIGVDMTPEMIKLARENAQKAGFTNVEFRLGEIEHLPVADESIDVIISNCVINLSLDKQQVFREAYRVLKPGGRICIADVVATAPIPAEIKNNLEISGCIAGAEEKDKIAEMLSQTGFRKIKLTPEDKSSEIIGSWLPGSNIEDFVASYLIEAEK